MRIGLPSTSTTACRFCESEIDSLLQVREHRDAYILIMIETNVQSEGTKMFALLTIVKFIVL